MVLVVVEVFVVVTFKPPLLSPSPRAASDAFILLSLTVALECKVVFVVEEEFVLLLVFVVEE